MKTNEANVVIEYQGVKLHPHCVPDSVGIVNNSVIDAYNLILYKSIVNSRSLDRAKTLIDTNEEKDTEDHVENLNMSLKISFKSGKILVRVSSVIHNLKLDVYDPKSNRKGRFTRKDCTYISIVF